MMNESLWHLVAVTIAIVTIVFVAVTVVIALIAHFLKGKKRAIATSILLATGTLSMATSYLIMLLPVVGSVKDLHTDQGFGTVNKLNLVGLNMRLNEASLSFHPLLKEYLRVVDNVKETREEELRNSAEELWSFLKDKQKIHDGFARKEYEAEAAQREKTDLRLILAALDVVEHERKEPSKKLEAYFKDNKIGETSWHFLIEKIYSDTRLQDAELKALFSPEVLPSQWYADQLKIRIAKTFGPTPESAKVQNRILLLNSHYSSRVLLITIVTSAYFLIGVMILVLYLKQPRPALPDKWTAVPWGFKGAWGTIVWAFYMQIPISLLLSPRFGIGFGDGISRIFINKLFSEVVILILTVWFIQSEVCKPRRMTLLEGLHLKALSKVEWKSTVQLIVSFFMVGIVFSYLSDFAVRLMTGDNINAYNPIRGIIVTAISTHNPFFMLCVAMLTCLLGPIFEEILFRGILFAWLRTRMNFVYAGLISSTIFGIAHGDMGAFFVYIGMGMLFALIFEKSKTLYAPIALHMIWNSNSFLEKLFWYYY